MGRCFLKVVSQNWKKKMSEQSREKWNYVMTMVVPGVLALKAECFTEAKSSGGS